MSGPARGWIYRFTMTGASAAFVLVLSEDDYNAVTRDVVIVPIFADDTSETSDAVARISSTHIAHCTRVTTVLQEDLGRRGVACPPAVLGRIVDGVRGYLAIERLLDEGTAPSVSTSRRGWWPQQGGVHYAPVDALDGEQKMFAVMSEDDWNARPGSTYSTGARLTSKRRAPGHWRAPLEVPVAGGGVVVAGHLYLLPHASMNPQPPNPPRPVALDAPQLAALASSTAAVLGL